LLAFSALAVYAGNRGGEIFPKPLAANGGPEERRRVSGDLLFSALKFDDEQLGEGMTITFPPTKTNKNKAVSVWLPALPNDLTCPVSLMRSYVAGRGRAPQGHEPLFVEKDLSALSRASCLKMTQRALAVAGIPIPSSQRLSSKSWRAGAAQSASLVPPDIDEIVKASGRWQSRAFSPYLHGREAHRVAAIAHSSRLQLARLRERVAPAEGTGSGGDLSAAASDRGETSDGSVLFPSPSQLGGPAVISPGRAAGKAASEVALEGNAASVVAQKSDASPAAARPVSPQPGQELAAASAIRQVQAAEAREEFNQSRTRADKRVSRPIVPFDSGLVW
jgi:hypothetical protein